MSKLYVQPVESNRFTFFKPKNEFVADISDLGAFRFQRLYDDAADVGLALLSSKTGKIALFYLQCEHTNGDGDITHWTLFPTKEAIKKNPGLAFVTMTIYND